MLGILWGELDGVNFLKLFHFKPLYQRHSFESCIRLAPLSALINIKSFSSMVRAVPGKQASNEVEISHS
jgi:hypothetical protein